MGYEEISVIRKRLEKTYGSNVAYLKTDIFTSFWSVNEKLLSVEYDGKDVTLKGDCDLFIHKFFADDILHDLIEAK